MLQRSIFFLFFFFNDTATTEIYTLSLHDALPISHFRESVFGNEVMTGYLNNGANPLSRVTIASLADLGYQVNMAERIDRKSTRLNSSHQIISYAVFCLKKKKKKPECT